MSKLFEKVKYLYSTLPYSERVSFVEFASELEKKGYKEIEEESKKLEYKAYDLGPVAVTSNGKCALCGK